MIIYVCVFICIYRYRAIFTYLLIRTYICKTDVFILKDYSNSHNKNWAVDVNGLTEILAHISNSCCRLVRWRDSKSIKNATTYQLACVCMCVRSCMCVFAYALISITNSHRMLGMRGNKRTNFHNERRANAEPTISNKRINGKQIAATCETIHNPHKNALKGRQTHSHICTLASIYVKWTLKQTVNDAYAYEYIRSHMHVYVSMCKAPLAPLINVTAKCCCCCRHIWCYRSLSL